MMPSKLWLLLVAVRFAGVFLPQTGYIHPDEFFQGPEVMAGDMLHVDSEKPWEFTSEQPIRSIIFPFLMTGAPMKFLAWLSSVGFASITSYTILIIPRIFVTLLSLVVDLCIHRMSQLLNVNPSITMPMFASSYVAIVYFTRTFTNVTESILFALFYTCIVDSVGFMNAAKKDADEEEEDSGAVWLGTIIALGIFNRPTFVFFAIVPLSYWLFKLKYQNPLESQSPTMTRSSKHQKVAVENKEEPGGLFGHLFGFAFGFMILFVQLVSLDSSYFNIIMSDNAEYNGRTLMDIIFDKTAEIYSTESVGGVVDNFFRNLIITPLNFISYNSQAENLADHGLHPYYLHILVNMQILFNILPIFVWLKFLKKVIGVISAKETFWQVEQELLAFLSMIVPLLLLSGFPHQEARFLVPLVFPLVLLAAPLLLESDKWIAKTVLAVWVVSNAVSCLVVGVGHQGGVVPVMKELSFRIHQQKESPFHVVFYHTYPPPTHLLALNLTEEFQQLGENAEEGRRVQLYDLKGARSTKLTKLVNSIIKKGRESYAAKDFKIYVVAPMTIDHVFCKSRKEFKYSLARTFPIHFSMEDTPKLMDVFMARKKTCNQCVRCSLLTRMRAEFSLNLYLVIPHRPLFEKEEEEDPNTLDDYDDFY